MFARKILRSGGIEPILTFYYKRILRRGRSSTGIRDSRIQNMEYGKASTGKGGGSDGAGEVGAAVEAEEGGATSVHARDRDVRLPVVEAAHIPRPSGVIRRPVRAAQGFLSVSHSLQVDCARGLRRRARRSLAGLESLDGLSQLLGVGAWCRDAAVLVAVEHLGCTNAIGARCLHFFQSL